MYVCKKAKTVLVMRLFVLSLFFSMGVSLVGNNYAHGAPMSVGSEEMLLKAQQGITITGTVKDNTGDPLPGVNINVKGATIGVVSDNNGTFTLLVPSEQSVLVFSYIGFTTQEITIGSQRSINIMLVENTLEMDEVVVVGYGTQKKRDVLGSVSSMNADEIARSRPTSVETAMLGKMSSVSVSTPVGVPGAPSGASVRGSHSISMGSGPLWIVDGIPISVGSFGSSYDGEVGQNILSMINPMDIESIQVLKDAAATAIYGSRATGGVIIVTTKTGKQGVNTFDVDIRTGVTNWTKTNVGQASGREWIEIMDLVRANSRMDGGFEPIQTLAQLDNYQSVMTREEAMNTNTNWIDQICRVGNFLDARLSASNGSEKANSYLSLNYRKEYGNFKFNDLQTITANINVNYKALRFLTLGYRLMASYTDNNRVKSGDGKQGAGGWAQANSNALPWMKVYDPDGINGYWNSQSYVNALAGIDPRNSESTLQALNVISGLTLDVKLPVDGLTLRGELGMNALNNQGQSWLSKSVRELGERARESKSQSVILNYNAYFSYVRSFNDRHNVNLVGGVEGTRANYHGTDLTAFNLVGPYHEIGTPGTLMGNSGWGSGDYMMGIFGRANYNFRSKYYAGFSMRRDGISQFIPENRWATFMSGSLGWVISEEDFFNIDAISFLKLRGSYGQTGNTNVPGGITEDNWSTVSGVSTLQGTNSKSLTVMGNRHVKWETANKIDVGFDFGALNNRINGSIAYYQEKIEDLLLRVSLPFSAGIYGTDANAIWQNIGDMVNYGVEMNLDAVVVNRKDFRWSIGGNLWTNSNKVLALDPESDSNGTGIFSRSGVSNDTEIRYITQKGYPISSWYISEYAGVDPQKGIPLIYEIETLADGSTRRTGKIIPATTENLAVNKMIQESKPIFRGGFNMNLSYKSFDLSMVWDFRTGKTCYVYDRLKQSMMTPNTGLLTLSRELLTDTWRKPGDNAKYPMTTYACSYYYDGEGNPTNVPVQYGSENKTPITLFRERGDYLRMNSIQIGSNLPQKWCNTIGMKNIRVYLSGNNLLLFTKFSGYDPTTTSVQFFSSLPSSRIYSFGVNAGF